MMPCWPIPFKSFPAIQAWQRGEGSAVTSAAQRPAPHGKGRGNVAAGGGGGSGRTKAQPMTNPDAAMTFAPYAAADLSLRADSSAASLELAPVARPSNTSAIFALSLSHCCRDSACARAADRPRR